MLSDKICVLITNYDFSSNAQKLKSEFSAFLPTVLVDSSSPSPPSSADITIPNTYYPGLWNAAVRYAIEHRFDYLMFVSSDLEIPSVKTLCDYAVEAHLDKRIGVWSPSVSAGSRTSFPLLLNQKTAYVRESAVMEGFFFLAKVSILREIYPIKPEHKYGWGVDLLTCAIAHKSGDLVVVDDRVEIFHPPSKEEHTIDKSQADAEWRKHIDVSLIENVHRRAASLLRKPRLFNNGRSLDLGCGPSPKNPYLASEVYGVDLFESSDGRIRAVDLNVEKLPFPDASFAYVTAYDFIEHVPRLIYAPNRRFPFVELMSEIWRVLIPGGIFMSVTPAFPNPEAFQDPTHVNIITIDTFPLYFGEKDPWSRMYGFTGRFKILANEFQGPKLVTLMRALK